MKFPESALAHQYLDGLDGIEIGGSAHNPFNIPGCRNVDYTDSLDTIFKQEEIRLCGEALPVDVVDEGDSLRTFADDSLDFILSSHVFEHFPNPLQALVRWACVLKDGGIIFLVVPHRDALDADRDRELTSFDHLLADFLTAATVETHPIPAGHGVRGHYHVFDRKHLEVILADFNSYLARVWVPVRFEVLDRLDRDDKVGNGFTLVLRVRKCTSP